MNPFDIGDPYVEWNELNSSLEESNETETETVMDMHVETLETFKNEIVKILVAEHDFSMDDAEETVEESVIKHADMWHAQMDAKSMAEFLASEENGD